jgi:hypothetical protein
VALSTTCIWAVCPISEWTSHPIANIVPLSLPVAERWTTPSTVRLTAATSVKQQFTRQGNGLDSLRVRHYVRAGLPPFPDVAPLIRVNPPRGGSKYPANANDRKKSVVRAAGPSVLRLGTLSSQA